jgi:hypothetical protein
MKREINASKDYAKQAEGASAEEADYMRQAADEERGAAEAQAGIYQSHAEKVKTLQADRRRELDLAMAQLNTFSDRYMAAAAQGTKPAPSLVSERTDAGVHAAIVTGLGALAMIVTRGNTNPLATVAADIIRRAENAIERDVRDKISRLDTLKTATSLADRQLQNIRQQFDDDRAFIDYVKEIHMGRVVDPMLKRAASSKNMATAAGAEAAGLIRQADQAQRRAALEGTLLSQAQKNAQLRLAAREQSAQSQQGFFKLRKEFGTTASKEVGDEWAKTEQFTTIAKRMVQLRKELGPIARAGRLAAWLKGGNNLAKYNEYKSHVRNIFTLDNELGAALTSTEIAFGEDKIGDPLAWLTGPDELDSVLRARGMAKVKNIQGKISVMGGLTESGRLELARMYASAGGGPTFANREGPKPARRRGGSR